MVANGFANGASDVVEIEGLQDVVEVFVRKGRSGGEVAWGPDAPGPWISRSR